jgi:hypothetical protein
MARFRRGCGCAAVLAVLAIAPAARARGVDIRVDPASPSGTEYELPLERARQDARRSGPPTQARPAERAAPAPAFGEGIQTPATSATAPRNQGLGQNRATPRGTAEKRTSSGAAARQTATAQLVAAPPPLSKAAGAPGSSLLGVGAIAAAVLALGAGIGLLLRWRASH